MDDATRAEALKKLATFDPRIGYPVEMARLLGLRRREGQALRERPQRRARSSGSARSARLGEPVDRSEWVMTPQTVNAYYNPLMNQITFPAGILQPPFFDPNADPAVNYGAIGAVIGHEIGHGFDDQGREFDEPGKIRNWWTPETNAEVHRAQTKKLGGAVRRLLPARRRLRQRPADDGREHRRPRRPGDGLHRLQAVAQGQGGAGASTASPATSASSWPTRRSGARMMRDDALRNQILTDPHSPPAARGSMPRAQHRRLVRGVRRQGRRQALSHAGAAREDLVGPDNHCKLFTKA